MRPLHSYENGDQRINEGRRGVSSVKLHLNLTLPTRGKTIVETTYALMRIELLDAPETQG